ncbi:MAG: hypothetical protein ACREOG_08070 [Gemmatimonadaceae bacterium]
MTRLKIVRAPPGTGGNRQWVEVLEVTQDTTCPPALDSILDSRAVRDSMKASLQRSLPNAAPGTGLKHERGGITWRMPDGSRLGTEVGPQDITLQTECRFQANWAAAASRPPAPGAVAESFWHTHPNGTGQPVYGCPVIPGEPPPAQYFGGPGTPRIATPNLNGGASNPDWNASSSQGFASYVINKEGRVYRLDPNTSPDQRPNNPNRWRWDDPTRPACFLHL